MWLPDCWCCYDPLCEALEPGEPPAGRTGVVTFGSLNGFHKTNSRVLELWAALLRAVDGSRLRLLAKRGSHRQAARELFAARGIAAERIEFVDPCPRNDYLRNFREIDIALDPFPYNGITTTCDALWMGVPVVSLIGKMAPARAGWSILRNIGLAEFAAPTETDFIRIAAELAHDLPRLTSLRAGLRSQMGRSPLMDAARFSRHVETAFRTMWRKWCAQH